MSGCYGVALLRRKDQFWRSYIERVMTGENEWAQVEERDMEEGSIDR